MVQNAQVNFYITISVLSCLYTDTERDSERIEGDDSCEMVPTWGATGNTSSQTEHY